MPAIAPSGEELAGTWSLPKQRHFLPDWPALGAQGWAGHHRRTRETLVLSLPNNLRESTELPWREWTLPHSAQGTISGFSGQTLLVSSGGTARKGDKECGGVGGRGLMVNWLRLHGSLVHGRRLA